MTSQNSPKTFPTPSPWPECNVIQKPSPITENQPLTTHRQNCDKQLLLVEIQQLYVIELHVSAHHPPIAQFNSTFAAATESSSSSHSALKLVNLPRKTDVITTYRKYKVACMAKSNNPWREIQEANLMISDTFCLSLFFACLPCGIVT